jgi:hypothetical protein
LLALVALPAHILVPASDLKPASGVVHVELPGGSTHTLTLGDPQPVLSPAPPAPPSASKRARAAAHHYRKDRPKRGMRVLSSLGTAPRTRLTADIAAGMHPYHGGAGPLPNVPTARVDIDEADSLASLSAAALDSQASADTFGWS